MGDMRTLGKGAIYTSIGMILSKCMTYVWRIIIARIGPENYGLISLAIAVLGISFSVSYLGLDSAIVRYVAYYSGKEDPSRIKGIIISAIKMVIPITLVVSIIVFTYASFISNTIFKNPELAPLLRVISFSILPYVLYNLSLAALNGLKKVECVVFLRQIFESGVRLVMTIFLLYMGYGVLGVGIAYALTYLFSAALAVYLLERTIPFLRNEVKAVSLKRELLNYSLPLLIGGLISQTLAWTDTIMIGYFKDVSQVGVYNTALPTASLLLIAPAALGSLFLPIITTNYAKGRTDDIRSLYLKITKLIIASNIPLLLIMVFFSENILTFFFGITYSQGSYALKYLAIGFFTYSAVTTSNSILDMSKKTKTLMSIGILSTVSNVILNYFLIPLYGMNGAGIASASSLIIASVFSIYYSYQSIGILPFNKSLFKLFSFGMICMGLMHILLHTIYNNITTIPAIVATLAFLLTYFFLIMRFKIVEWYEIELFLRFLKRR